MRREGRGGLSDHRIQTETLPSPEVDRRGRGRGALALLPRSSRATRPRPVRCHAIVGESDPPRGRREGPIAETGLSQGRDCPFPRKRRGELSGAEGSRREPSLNSGRNCGAGTGLNDPHQFCQSCPQSRAPRKFAEFPRSFSCFRAGSCWVLMGNGRPRGHTDGHTRQPLLLVEKCSESPSLSVRSS